MSEILNFNVLRETKESVKKTFEAKKIDDFLNNNPFVQQALSFQDSAVILEKHEQDFLNQLQTYFADSEVSEEAKKTLFFEILNNLNDEVKMAVGSDLNHQQIISQFGNLTHKAIVLFLTLGFNVLFPNYDHSALANPRSPITKMSEKTNEKTFNVIELSEKVSDQKLLKILENIGQEVPRDAQFSNYYIQLGLKRCGQQFDHQKKQEQFIAQIIEHLKKKIHKRLVTINNQINIAFNYDGILQEAKSLEKRSFLKRNLFSGDLQQIQDEGHKIEADFTNEKISEEETIKQSEKLTEKEIILWTKYIKIASALNAKCVKYDYYRLVEESNKIAKDNPYGEQIEMGLFLGKSEKFNEEIKTIAKDFKDGKYSENEFEMQIDELVKQLSTLLYKYIQDVESYSLFQKTTNLDLNELIELFPTLKTDSKNIEQAIQTGLEFRFNAEKSVLCLNYNNGLPVETFNLPLDVQQFKLILQEAISDFKKVPLESVIPINIIETITNHFDKDNLKITSRTAKKLQDTVNNIPHNFSLELENYDSQNEVFLLSVFENKEYKIGQINDQQKSCFWEQKLLGIIQSRINAKPYQPSEKIQAILQKNAQIEYPSNLSFEDKKIEMANALIKAFLENSFSVDYQNIFDFLNGLSQNIQIPYNQKNDIIFSFYKKLIEKKIIFNGVSLDVCIFNNLESFLPSNENLLKGKNLSKEDFNKLVMINLNFLTREFIPFLLQTNPEEVLKKINIITALVNLNVVTTMSVYDIQSPFFGKSACFVSLLKYAFSVNPILSQKYDYLYKNNSALVSEVELESQALSNYSAIRINPNAGSPDLNDFNNANHFPYVLEIVKSLPNDWITEITGKISNQELADIKLSVARNISLKSGLNAKKTAIDFKQNQRKRVQQEVKILLKEIKNLENKPIFSDKNIFHLAHYGQGVDAFGQKATVEAIKNQQTQKRGEYILFDAETQKGKNVEEQKEYLQNIYNKIIKSQRPTVIILEGHANSDGFSFLFEYKNVSKWEIAHSGIKTIQITPIELAKIFIKRQSYRDKYKITDPDLIIFSACEGDYIVNFYTKIHELLGNQFCKNFIPPAIMTSSEAGENSLFDPNKPISQQIFREVLKIDQKKEITYGMFEKNQYIEKINSNPSLYYPIFMDGKWMPHNLK